MPSPRARNIALTILCCPVAEVLIRTTVFIIRPGPVEACEHIPFDLPKKESGKYWGDDY